jgi:aminobenzoyl-glutamate utilization protein B
MSTRCSRPIFSLLVAASLAARADAPAPATDAYLDKTRPRWEQTSRQIWEFAETGLEETRSSALLADVLAKEGFKVQRGVAGMPTAFVATAGSGSPVIAILAEYDALPGLSQKAGEAQKDPLVKGAPGHGCGHNLLGTAAVAAAVAANQSRIEQKLPGTIQVFGTPAEEVISAAGKTFMLKAGAFQGTDLVLSWHPLDDNEVIAGTRLAVTSLNVEFFGKTAHAAGAPWLGRSALDAMEVFEHAMSLMREHLLPTARIHRVIKNGGMAANIIPDYSKVEWWLRDSSSTSVQEMIERLKKAADGAALATETRAKVTVLGSLRNPINNEVIGRVMQKELERVGAPHFDERDVAFARALQKELGVEQSGLSDRIVPYARGKGSTASSDIAEVSAALPLAELGVATRARGTAAHHWAQTACAAHPLGFKGMLVAAKVLGGSMVDLLSDSAAVAAAKAEFAKTTKGKPYVSPLSDDAKPAIF